MPLACGPGVVGEQADDTTSTTQQSDTTNSTAETETGGAADLTLTGSAQALYLLMWNRTDGEGVTMTGDTSLLTLWRTSCRVRWDGGE